MVGYGLSDPKKKYSGKRRKGFNKVYHVASSFIQTTGHGSKKDYSNAVTLPGDSGSPLLADDGAIGITSVGTIRGSQVSSYYTNLKSSKISDFSKNDIDPFNYTLVRTYFH